MLINADSHLNERYMEGGYLIIISIESPQLFMDGVCMYVCVLYT